MQCPDLGADLLPPEEQLDTGYKKMPSYTMPILKVAPKLTPDTSTAFTPVGPPMVRCAPGWTGPDCKTPITVLQPEPPPSSPGGNGVVTEPVPLSPASPTGVPWWKQIATALVPGTQANGAFGTGTAFGPSVQPKVSAAGPGVVQAGMGLDQIPPALRNVMLAGAGLFLLSLLVKK